ncbi:hypothetical protein Acr_06g0005870 [Actinidia rufa]|uniref:Uncharacterized protein n=1 Tax=Actinidia rufa TaxID=165716 RepID=A0A7J0ESW3_9ERIC|nr:hypothetical protein Acr_06g0005870 [Actinidia rufa]
MARSILVFFTILVLFSSLVSSSHGRKLLTAQEHKTGCTFTRGQVVPKFPSQGHSDPFFTEQEGPRHGRRREAQRPPPHRHRSDPTVRAKPRHRQLIFI